MPRTSPHSHPPARDVDLDQLAQSTDEDVNVALSRWREDAPADLAGLLDAAPCEPRRKVRPIR